jgi:protein-S-isoprenylcysteine O-methyltransferase Ste14
MKDITGKVAYGVAFTILLPALLILWARQTEAYVPLPVPNSPLFAWGCVVAGAGSMIWAMADLWLRGKGLPMNAYPPEKLVTRGIYRYVSHPIYMAASVMCIVVSLLFRSSSGFWLVSPVLTFSWIALVWGFENADLQKRFAVLPEPVFSLPENTTAKADVNDRLSACVLVLVPWVLLYEALIFIGNPSRPVSTFTFPDDTIPMVEWTELFYFLCYPFVGLVPLVLQQKQQIRSFMIAGWLVVAVGFFLQIVLPFVAEPKPFVPHSVWGELLVYERSKDGAAAAFPSFHVIWAWLAAYYYAVRWKSLGWLWYALAIAISISCLTTGMHSVLDVMAGLGVFRVAIYRNKIWAATRNFFERLANSWHAWQVGGLRIINHSIYVGLSACVGILLVSMLLGNTAIVWTVSIFSLAGAALWAQLVEGASGLSRPFGYYGSILGGLLGCACAADWFAASFWTILAAFALASPWIQALGRLRCVVQGCCHGRLAEAEIGIRVQHEKSRVCALSQLKNQPIHITPAYSILSNVLIGAFLWRLWYGQIPAQFLVGLYFILNGLSRFVEEAYRGEIQTPVWNKLKLYQWMAFGSVWLGIVCTTIPAQATVLPLSWQPSYLATALVFGLVAAFAMGMDFPYSNKRFSRLAN